MVHGFSRMAAALLALGFTNSAFAQNNAVTIVLSEELDIVDPCEA